MPLKMLQTFRKDPRLFIERFCYIRDKERRTAPLKFNFAQSYYYCMSSAILGQRPSYTLG
jgi:hypothetical protein